MLSKSKKQNELVLCSLDELVPKDHLVRKLNKIDYSFIYDKVRDYYSEDGRPSIDPIILFKILLIKHFFNIRSIRQTIKEIEVNVAYRWFLNLSLKQKVPHYSVISNNFNKRFKDKKVMINQILRDIIQEAVDHNILLEKEFKFNNFKLKLHKNKKTVQVDEKSLYTKPLV